MPNGAVAAYSWFADGLLKSVDYGAGMKREYAYDNADRLTQVTNTVGTDPSIRDATVCLRLRSELESCE